MNKLIESSEPKKTISPSDNTKNIAMSHNLTDLTDPNLNKKIVRKIEIS